MGRAPRVVELCEDRAPAADYGECLLLNMIPKQGAAASLTT